MSKSEILAELPKLRAEERAAVFECLCQLQEKDLLAGTEPIAEDRKLLDAAFAEFQQDRNPGRPWREVLQAIRPNRKS